MKIGKNMATGKLSSKFQIAIPKEVREEMQLQSGQTFYIIRRGATIQLIPKRSMEEYRGTLAGASTRDLRDRKDRV